MHDVSRGGGWDGGGHWRARFYTSTSNSRNSFTSNPLAPWLYRQKRIYDYEGTVRQFLVDDKGMVLIACFGLVAHENDAERATRCAMEISTDLRKERIISSSGVTTGEVYCGLVGGETRCEYALIGDVVNMAARLMASTSDEIRCDLATYTRSCTRVVFEKLEPIKVKGKEEKQQVFKP